MTACQSWTEQINRLCRSADRRQRLAGLPPGARVAALEGEHNRQIVLALVSNLGDVSITEVVERTGLTRETVSKHLRDLATAGQVIRLPSKRWICAP